MSWQAQTAVTLHSKQTNVKRLRLLLFLANGGVVPLSEAALSQQLQRGGLLDFARYGRVRLWGSLGFVVSGAQASSPRIRGTNAHLPRRWCRTSGRCAGRTG